MIVTGDHPSGHPLGADPHVRAGSARQAVNDMLDIVDPRTLQRDAFLDDVIAGLSRPRKRLPSCWLYDEVDLVWDRFGMYVHRILFSDGSVWVLPFARVTMFNYPRAQKG